MKRGEEPRLIRRSAVWVRLDTIKHSDLWGWGQCAFGFHVLSLVCGT